MEREIKAAKKRMRLIRNIGIIAHIDAGKTTVTERMLYITGKTYKMGEVHDGQAVMDYLIQEQERGITITSAVTYFGWKGFEIHLIDTPGHVDFTIEVERSLRVLDGVVIVFDGVHGVEPQSEAVWHQADKYKVPRIAFINKMDRIGAEFNSSIKMMSERFSQRIIPVQIPLGSEDKHRGVIDLITMVGYEWDGIDPKNMRVLEKIPDDAYQNALTARESMIVNIGDFDDKIAEKYLESVTLKEQEIKNAIRRLVLQNKIVPVFCGSALRNRGIQPILDGVIDYLPSPEDVPPISGENPLTGEEIKIPSDPSASFSALAFKVQFFEGGRKIIFIRIYSGSIGEKDEIYNASRKEKEKISRIFLMHAKEKKRIEWIHAGHIVGIIGPKNLGTGDTLSHENSPLILEAISKYTPVISQRIEPLMEIDKDKLEEVLSRISDEDPTFFHYEDKETGEMIISGMGELHLEIIVDRIQRDYRVNVRTGKPHVLYNETITEIAEGTGTFEGVVEDKSIQCGISLMVEPLGRNEGIKIESLPDIAVSENVLNIIREGLIDTLSGGILHGYPINDIKATIKGVEFMGETYDPVALKIAATNALRNACQKAKTKILQPIGTIEILVPSEYLGDVIHSIHSRGGMVFNVIDRGPTKIIEAKAPIEKMFGYSTELRSITQGRGTFSMKFSHYDIA